MSDILNEQIFTIDTEANIQKDKKVEPLQLFNDNHPMLSKEIPEYKIPLPNPNMNLLINRLKMTMKKYSGLGLSANQCGVFERVFVIGTEHFQFACINPKIIDQSAEMIKEYEGCLSYPALYIKIDRPSWIMASYYNENGEKMEVKMEGLTARCFQHELDHMNGIKFVEHVGPVALRMAKQKRDKVIKTIDEIPAGPFKGMKNTIKSYFQLLNNAGKKSAMFQKRAGVLTKNFQKGTAAVKDVELLKNYLKTQKVFNPATLTKPGFFTNVFFGGIPRLFRSPSQRRLRILMQSTKWWLGFLDYVGLGNWVGAEELSKKMGDENFMKKVDEYNQTPEAKQNFEDQFGSERVEGQTNNQQSTSSSTSSEPNLDPLAKFLRGLFTGQMNPIPGM